LTLSRADGKEWQSLESNLRGTGCAPSWSYSRASWALSPRVTFRWDEPLLKAGIVFHADTRRRHFFTPPASEALERLARDPCTEDDLRAHLVDLGVNPNEFDVACLLEELEREQLVVRGTRNRLLSMGVDSRLNRTGRFEIITDSRTGLSVPGSPVSANIYITLDCNLSCRHCGITMDDTRPRYLSAGEWHNVFDDFERNAVQIVILNGGEPLIHPEAREILRDLGRRPFFVRVYSNGTLLDEEIADICSRSRNFLFSISLDGHTAEIHDDFRGVKGAFERTLRGMRLLREADRPVPFFVASIIHRGVVPYLKELADFVEDQGSRLVAFLAMNFVGRARQTDYYICLEKHQNIVDEIRDIGLARQERMAVSLQARGPTVRKDPSRPRPYQGKENICACGILDITVGPDGESYPCEACFTLDGAHRKSFAVGSLPVDGLAKVWASPRWSLLRGGVERADLKACAACDRYGVCGQRRCRFYSLASHGDLMGPARECLDYLDGVGIVG